MSKNKTAVEIIVQSLVSFQSEENNFLKKKGEVYEEQLLTMAEEGITFGALAERFQVAENSDWPKNEDGTFQGQMKAGTSASVYGVAFWRFLSWSKGKYSFDEEGLPELAKGGELVEKPKKEATKKGASKRKEEKAGKVLTLTGSEAVEVVLKDLWKIIDGDRSKSLPGASKAATALTTLATYLGVKL